MASVSKRRWTHNGVTKEKWVVRYHDPATGKRPSRQFELKKVAEAFMRKVEREIEDGTHTIAADKATVAAIADAFIADAEDKHRAGRLGRSRLDRFRTVARRYVTPAFGEKCFADVTVGEVEALYNRMTGAQGLAPITARENIVVLRMMERFARKRHNLRVQPVTEALADIKGAPRRRVRTFTPEEVSKLLATADVRAPGAKGRTHAMMRCLVNLGAFCGLRMGELLGLTRDHVDLDQRVIRVRHSLTQYGLLKGPKTRAGVRDVPLPGHVAVLVADWIATWFVPNERDLIFRTQTGGAIAAQNYRVSWHALLRRAGLHHEDDPHHFHALRHFTTSWMLANNLPLPDIAQLLGHESFDVTLQVYAHPVVAPHMRHDAIERMVTQLPAAPDATAPQRSLSH